MELYAIPYILGIISVDSLYDHKTATLSASTALEEILTIKHYYTTQDTSYLTIVVPILFGLIAIGIIGNIIRKASILSVMQLVIYLAGTYYFVGVVDPIRKQLLVLDDSQDVEILNVLRMIINGHFVIVGAFILIFLLGVFIRRQ
eukprot:TRINITY_DN13267_c0_g1_i1.p1 TRINITY_DN13267_c0_g1~~TRINITY_DN13267_c0_g1_i1.p1  ORF type:complete len:166 (-),score=10.81 TRINITY_DN13267_c0_g1_i1:49-483(-)